MRFDHRSPGPAGPAPALFRERYTEDKLAGIRFLQELLIPAGAVRCDRDVGRFAGLFGAGAIHDWNVCDWFAVKVLGPLIRAEGRSCARRIAVWPSAEDLWQARAGLVAFVGVAADATDYSLVERSCRALIRREERFAKTAVGWVLREVSKHDRPFVRRVLDANLGFFSREALRSATKGWPASDREAYLRRLRDG
jgi:3-methyladenine DNA glycosylase AlkD